MQRNIILSSDESIVCPHCQQRFSIDRGITRQTMERYEREFEAVLDERGAALREELAREAEKKLKTAYNTQLNTLRDELDRSQLTLKQMQGRIEAVQQETKAKLLEDFALEKKLLQQDLTEKNSKLRLLQEQELQLRQEKNKLEQAQRELELSLQRRLDEERKKIEELIRANEAERFQLIEAEYRKKIEDAQRANEESDREDERGQARDRGRPARQRGTQAQARARLATAPGRGVGTGAGEPAQDCVSPRRHRAGAQGRARRGCVAHGDDARRPELRAYHLGGQAGRKLVKRLGPETQGRPAGRQRRAGGVGLHRDAETDAGAVLSA